MAGRAPAPRVRVTGLKLTDFRNYSALALEFGPGPVVFTGENGAGKTNLLEALSLLSPGRGLRRAPLSEMARAGSAQGFAVSASVAGPGGEAEIGTGTYGAVGEAQRRIRIDGAPARAAEDLLEYLRVMWVTPAMDTLFSGPPADRRRFLDRLTLAIDPGHGRRALDYEKAMRGRNRLLADNVRDAAWLSALEAQMAETGTALALARREMVGLLAAMIGRLPGESPFPKADIAIETDEETSPPVDAIAMEEGFRAALAAGRERDRAAGRALAGPHRADLLVRHRPKDMPAALCSTGEQKALLVGLVLAHARLTGELAGMAPVLLLDEIGAHFDEGRRAALFAIIEDLNCQAFMTGTERTLFSSLEGRAQFVAVSGGRAG